MENIEKIVSLQEEYFKSGVTKDVGFRLSSLLKLKRGIIKYEDKIFNALHRDLGKSETESYLTEVGFVLDEISFTLKHLKKWVKPKKVKTSISQMPGKSYIYNEPYGNILIMSPWNYPFQLAIAPLTASIAGGNCSIIKPSEYSSYTSKVIKELIEDVFDKEFVCVIEGGRRVNTEILNEKFDYIFFTGSVEVGKIVMEKASKNLTPVTLELGGKSPCIVDKTCNIEMAAKKIVWGKFLNSGQTCVAPDYLLIHSCVKDAFIKEVKKYIKVFYGENPLLSSDYSKIINEKHFNRLINYLDGSNIILGGEIDSEALKISPTFIDSVNENDLIMNEEIFGPILPIIEYSSIDEVINLIKSKPKPLALYLFCESYDIENKVLSEISFGGGCINDAIIHIASPYMPFGGVGNSGIGSYHGEYGFNTFTHRKSILKKSKAFDIPLRYPPYKGKLDKIKKILK